MSRRRRHRVTDYANYTGLRCPACNSTMITGQNFTANDSAVYLDCTCDDCPAVWTEEYELIGYSGLEIGGREVPVPGG